MARPAKAGLDYFPLDVNLDEKFDYIEAVHGIVGFGVILKLYQRIYRCGYFIPWTDKDVTLFASRIQGATKEQIEKIVADCVSEGIFSKDMFDVHKILTSSGIQKRYLLITKRREKRIIESNYCLVQLPLMADVPVDNNPHDGAVSAGGKGLSVDGNATKESKEKESKENKSRETTDESVPNYPLEETLLQHWGIKGRLGYGVLTQFVDLIKKHTWERVEYAIKEAGVHSACSLAYVKGILEPSKKPDEISVENKQDFFGFQTFLTQHGKKNGEGYSIEVAIPGKEWKFSGDGIASLYRQFKPNNSHIRRS